MFKDYIRFIWIFLRITGVNIGNGLLRNLILLIIILLISVIMVLLVLDCIFEYGDEKLPDVVNNVTAFILAVPSLFVLHWKTKTFKELFNFEGFWPVDHINEAVKNEQLKTYKFSLRCTKIEVYSAILANFSMILIKLFFFNGELPIPMYNIVDFTVTPNYEIIYVLIVIAGWLDGATGLAMNISFYFFLTFIYCQMTMLKYAFKNLFSESSGNIKVDEEICFRKLTEYMEYHIKILEYYKKFHEVYSIFMFCQAITIGGNCAVQLFILSRSGGVDILVVMPALVAAYLTAFFLQCVAVTIVTKQMESVAEAVYASDWTNVLSPRLKTGMILIIQKCQRGYDFKAGNLIDINLNTFTTIIKTMYSVYTLLVTVKSEN